MEIPSVAASAKLMLSGILLCSIALTTMYSEKAPVS